MLHDTAETIEDGESVDAMRGWAKTHGVTLVGGSITERREGREKLSNTCLVFDPEGELVATYRKIHLFDVEVGGLTYRESEAEEHGEEPVVAEIEGWPVGLTICYDLRFPELYRVLALEGALLATVPAHFTLYTGQGPLAPAAARARRRERLLRRRAGSGGRDGHRTPELRAIADRRSLGDGARTGAGRGDGDLRRARPRLARRGAAAAAVAVAATPGGVPLADPGLDRAWQAAPPRLVEECAEQWDLELEEPFAGGYVSLVVPAGDVVLKIQWPHRESEHEAAALELWDGDGAVRLLARDEERHALLLERCRPGT